MTYEAVTLREYGVIEEVWGIDNVIRGGVMSASHGRVDGKIGE